ncbi:MAG: hypothetical protein AAGA62_16675, partial [Bacteroidota bacterium]
FAMPIKNQEQLTALCLEVEEAISKADTDQALATLLAAIPSSRPKHNQVLLLASRMADIYKYEVGNTLVHDKIEILRNDLRSDILLFTDRLSLVDFSEAAPSRPELRPGHLLYKVPHTMQLRRSEECLVRVAHKLNQLLQGLEIDDSVHLEEIPVAEVMEVEIIDPNTGEDAAFDVLLLSDGEQLVDAYSYTEWVFQVRPLRLGQHQLILKISVLITVKGKERTKNIILRRAIEVTAEAQVLKEVPLMRLDYAAVSGTSPKVHESSDKPTESNQEDDFSGSEAAAEAPILGSTQLDRALTEKPKRTPKGGGQTPPPAPPPPQRPAAEPAMKPPAREVALPGKRKSRRSWMSMAATILLLVLGGWWVINLSSSPDRTTETNPGSGEVDPGVVQPNPNKPIIRPTPQDSSVVPD